MKLASGLKKWFTAFIIGRNTALIPGEAEYKMVMLRGNLAIVGVVVGICYIFIDHANGIYGNEPYYIATSAISILTVILVRAGKYKLSTILSVSVMNFLIFLFAASDTYRSGVYIFFVANSLTAFALFGYKDKGTALICVAIALMLFGYSYWTSHPWLPKRIFNEAYIQLEFTINFIVSLLTCIAIVYFLIDVNFHSEKQIRAKNEQLAKANSELDRFVYSASHDMRAPLSSILGLVQIYKLSESEEEKNKVVDLIRNRANKLDDFIREILDYSRNSRVNIRLQSVDPMVLIAEAIEGLRYVKDFEKISIEIATHSETMVMTDVERLKVILNNLLANVIKYHDGGKPNSYVKIKYDKDDSSWTVVIEDNGIGIHPDHQSKIFDMFYRAHENSEGSGLGLYIAQEAAGRLGGVISLQSSYGKGCTFTIKFPVRADKMEG